MTRSQKRLSIAAVIALVTGGGLYWLINQKGDIVLPSDTRTLIAAIKYENDGSQAVTIDTSGKITPADGWTPGNTDRDLAWDPKGNRLFFISDRNNGSFHIFRWDPQRGGRPQQRTVDVASRNDLSFDAQDDGSAELSGLVTVRGVIQEFVPRTAQSNQVLPPSARRADGSGTGSEESDEGGGVSRIKLMYDRFGNSFKSARWVSNRSSILTIMRRDDGKEALVLQKLGTDEKGKYFAPQLLIAASRIEMAVSPKDGNAAAAAVDLIPPPDADPKTVPRHGLFKIDLNGPSLLAPMILSPEAKVAFHSVAISPNGDKLMFVQGNYAGEGNIEPRALLSCTFAENAGPTVTPLVRGSVSEPQFSPDGTKILFLKRDGSGNGIFLANADGSNPKNLTQGKGDFTMPRFSPQFKE